jgi:hypothetical protein
MTEFAVLDVIGEKSPSARMRNLGWEDILSGGGGWELGVRG